MNILSANINKYYLSQKNHHNSTSTEKDNWNDESTVDYWRHKRMYTQLDPYLTADKGATWLTVGDGTYGREAHYIENAGGKVVATDLSTNRLKIAKNSNYISSYKKANAEKLPFESNSFDYVVCKESYHHFPRPHIALYEMIRVSRKSAILIEPNDVRKRRLSWPRIWGVEELTDYSNRFEVSGNYVYLLSRRDIEKVAFGMGLPCVAFTGLDDYYIPGIEHELLADLTPKYLKIRLIINLARIAQRLGMRDYSLIVASMFKTMPSRKLRNRLTEANYQLHFLTQNPHLQKNHIT